MKIDLLSNELFGNEAAEDESPEILSSYFVEKHEFTPFYNAKVKFQIVMSRKGIHI